MRSDVPFGLAGSDAWPFHLSDARWARLWAVLRAHDQTPRPYAREAQARELLLVLLYRALTAVPWQDIPAPPRVVDQAQRACTHWQELGVLDRLSDELRVQLAAV
jgi:transposase